MLLSRVTVGGNVKVAAGELLAWAPVHLHHTLPLATTLQFVLCEDGAVCPSHFPAALYFAYCLLQIQWQSSWLVPYAGI